MGRGKASQKAEDERTAGRWWSEYLKKAGYRTYMTGKWHVRAKAENCFDVVRNLRGGCPTKLLRDTIGPSLANLTHGVPTIQNLKVSGKEENTGVK